MDELHVGGDGRGDWSSHLRKKFAGQEKLNIHQADVLQTDLSAMGTGRDYGQPALLHNIADH